MKYLSFIFVLALLSTPLFATEYLTEATSLGFLDGTDSAMGDNAIELLYDTFGVAAAYPRAGLADSDPAVAGTLAKSDYLGALNPAFTDAVLTEIIVLDPSNTWTTIDALLAALDEIVDEIYQCYAVMDTQTMCACGAEGTHFNADYVATGGTACTTGEVEEASVITFNKWLDSRKLTGAATGTLPGIDDDDLTTLKTGVWTGASCYTTQVNGANAGLAGCANEYSFLRDLWDSAVVPGTALVAGGFTDLTVIPTLLSTYETSQDSDIWDKIAEQFVGSDAEWVDDDISIDDFAGLFCNSDGTLLDAADIEVDADFSDAGDFDELALQWFLDEADFEVGTDFEFGSPADYYWLSAICPGDGSTDLETHIEAWFDLLVALGDFGATDAFPKLARCNLEFVPTEATPAVEGDFALTVCPECPAVAADGTSVQSAADEALGIVRSEENGNCLPPPPPPPAVVVEDDPATDCDETVTDVDNDLFCEVDTDDAARGLAATVSLLAIMLSLWK